MKNKLLFILLALILILIACLFGLSKLYQSEKKERLRFENNYQSEKTDRAREQVLTRKEFVRYEDSLCSLAKKLSIKPKYIKQAVQVDFQVRDTVLCTVPTVLDTVTKVHDFYIATPCYNLTGFYTTDSLTITQHYWHDKLDLFLYKAYEKCYFFGLIKCGKYYTAKAYSECKEDTVQVWKNISIK